MAGTRSTTCRCRDELSPPALGPDAASEAAQQRFARINDLLKLLTQLDGLAQRFFESHKGLRAAIDLLAPPGE